MAYNVIVIISLILFACLAYSFICVFHYKEKYEALAEIYKSYEGIGVIKEPILNTFRSEYYRNEEYTSFYDENKVIHIIPYRNKYQFYKEGDSIKYQYHPEEGFYEILN